MLENYYDLAKSDEFERLFGSLRIGENPTPRHNQYFVMHWDFSMVASHGDTRAIEQALHDHINVCVQGFIDRYREHLPQVSPINPANALASFHTLVNAVNRTPYKLYLFIDEYDNFANEVMAAQLGGKDRYATLVHGEGILKTLFKAIKALSSGQGLDRIFITGVSPVVMSDISSGYNVAKDISFRPEYHDLCGFHAGEVAGVLGEIGEECGLADTQVAEALAMMRTFYNGYRFGYAAGPLLYNPTLALYFLDEYRRDCAYPRKILDDNLAMDRNRIEYIARLPHGNELVTRTLDPTDSILIDELANRFGVEDMLTATRDQPFLVSLMYYLGILTFADSDAMGDLKLRIPNLVIRRLEALLRLFGMAEGVDDGSQVSALGREPRGPIIEPIGIGRASVVSDVDGLHGSDDRRVTVRVRPVQPDAPVVEDQAAASEIRRAVDDVAVHLLGRGGNGVAPFFKSH